MIQRAIQQLQFKFRFMKRSFGKQPFKLLDVGAGNHSASKTCRLFPGCEYHGIDITREYNNDASDFSAMKELYEMDLTQLKFDVIPDNYFDGIWMAHIIEHLHNGDEVVKGLLPKLKSGGYIFIEYPGKKSLTLPSMYGTMNFYDDSTHVRVYSTTELDKLLSTNNCSVISKGTRRNWPYIWLTPLRLVQSVVKYKKVNASVFWDWVGFAEFVYARKK